MSVTAPRDARSLAHPTLEEMRRLAVRRVLGGESQHDVAVSLEVHPHTVWKWIELYRGEGDEGLASTKATGREPKLTARQSEQLKRIVIGKNPQQLSLGPALWTIGLVGEVILKKFEVILHKATVGRMLHRMGLTPQKPVRRAFQRDEATCLHWMTTAFPQIVRDSQKRQSTLLFGDETGVHEDGPTGTTWGVKGTTPVVAVTGSRRRTNVISAVSPRGRLWFRCFGGMLNAGLFIEFLRALLADMRGEIDLLLDRHPAHVAAATRRFVQDHQRRLRLHFLPPYAPDLNPDEHVWTHLKGMFRRDPIHDGEDLIDAVKLSMQHIQIDRALVRSFFESPEVEYVRKALKW